MNKLYDKKQKDLTAWGLAAAVSVLCLVRLVLAAQGRVILLPDTSPIDDRLMYNAAVSITEGRWLGNYAYNCIAKQMFFSVWVALLHTLGVPYLIGNAALGLLGAWVTAAALRPLLRRRWRVLTVFALLAYCPVGFDQFNYRVYRDSITIPLMLLALGGMTGCVLRLLLPEQARRPADRLLYAAVGGLGLGASWLNREDGVWLLPFFVCIAVLTAAVLLKKDGPRRAWKALTVLLVPFVLLGGCLAAYAGMNLKYYDRFILSDLTSDDFVTAYGLLTGIEDEGTGACRPITYATRQKLYANSAFFAALEPYWEHPMVLNGYGSTETHEYGGSYYYGLRLANQLAGHYADAAETEAFYREMTAELLRLEEEGVIAFAHRGHSTVPYRRWEYLVPTLRETGSGLAMALWMPTFDPAPQMSVFSDVPSADPEEMLAFLRADMVRGYVAGTDQPYYNPLQRAVFLAEDALCLLWRVCILPAVLAGLWAACRGGKNGFALLLGKKTACGTESSRAAFAAWVLLWGLLLTALLRCGLMAYMEVTAFAIGTYLMYLSTAVPLLGVCGALGVFALCDSRKPAGGAERP